MRNEVKKATVRSILQVGWFDRESNQIYLLRD